tara:strand:+ start:323 stop:430 length:108 start_codon:yes stop_codon:yes gene_type:complete
LEKLRKTWKNLEKFKKNLKNTQKDLLRHVNYKSLS